MLAILVLARAVHIGSTMLLVALPYFALVVMQPNDSTDGYGNFRARMWSWWWGALIQATISGVVWFWLVASQMADQSLWQTMSAEDLGTVLWQTWFGQLWLARGIAGFFLAGSMYLAGRRGAGFFSMGSLWAWLALTLSLGLLMSIAGAGHAESGIHDHLFHLAVDGSHLLLGAIWPMGLIPLGLFLRADFTRGENRAGENELRILRRFSRGSLIAVLLLLSTGVMNSFLMIGSWSDLATTTYGKLLVGKVAVVLVMIFLGAMNRRCLVPRRAATPEMLPALRRNIAAESWLGAVVLIIVGIMGMTAPPG